MSRHISIKGLGVLAVLASISCSFFAQSGPSHPTPSESSPTQNQEISLVVSALEGGELTLPDRTVLRIPPGSLRSDTQVSIRKITAENLPAVQQELVIVGGVYGIDLGTGRLGQPATLEIPFDPALLPDDTEPNQVFLSYYDENEQEWVYAGGEVDTNRSVVILQITHASWWMPTTWNWGAWIAVLNKILRVGIVDLVEAMQLLMDDCPQTGKYVQVDSNQARNIVQGCVERDDAERPVLRVVNPKSFFFEVQPVSGGNGYPAPALLSPGEDLEFEASTSDPSPLIIEAQMTERSSWYLVVHMVITMLPGANQFGIQGHHIACITERLADVSHFASAAESLVVDHNGAAAAESICQFMRDGDAVRRFITVADDCNFGPASTWSWEGIRQIGGAVSTIMSATDYIANYLAGNTNAQVSFVWTALPDGRIVFTSDRDGNMDIYVMDADGTNQSQLTDDPAWDWWPAWSHDGRLIAFYSGRDGNAEVYVMNADGSDQYNLTQHPRADGRDLYGGPPAWSPDGRFIAFHSDRAGLHIWDIYVMNADGSNLRRLTSDFGLSPVWSPDGRSIVFVCPGDLTYAICTMDADGSNKRKLIDMPLDRNQWSCEFALSPDGRSIVFSYHDFQAGNYEIYIMDADGANRRNLTQNPAYDTGPIWSPNGRFIAFASDRDGNLEIYVMNADGSNQRNLTQHPANDTRPGWSP